MIESETKDLPKVFAIKNTTHGCCGFATKEEALGQIERCKGIPEKLRWFPVGKGCQVCDTNDLPDTRRSDITKCCFGTKDGPVDHHVRVIYLPNAE